MNHSQKRNQFIAPNLAWALANKEAAKTNEKALLKSGKRNFETHSSL